MYNTRNIICRPGWGVDRNVWYNTGIKYHAEKRGGQTVRHKISDVGIKMLRYQEQHARQYRYKPILRTFFKDVRAEFEAALPDWCIMTGDNNPLETACGTEIAKGYTRIVIGDYGAFVEMTTAQINMDKLHVKEGQAYRIEDPRYAEHVKYIWYTAADQSDVKIYLQKRSVEYADYKPGMIYVSVYEVFPVAKSEQSR